MQRPKKIGSGANFCQIGLLSLVVIGAGTYYYNSIYQVNASDLAVSGIVNNRLASSTFRQKNRDFFKSQGLVYLDHPEVVSSVAKSLPVEQTERYLANPKHFAGLGKRYGRLVAQGYMAPLSIRFINDQIGYGVFAEADIAEGEMVGEYTGQINDTATLKTTKYTWVYPVTHDQRGKPVSLSLDALKFGNEMRYVNHDYKPNAAMQTIPQGGIWHIVYIANRPIKKGEQILTNYGTGYWGGSRGAPFQFVNEDGTQKGV